VNVVVWVVSGVLAAVFLIAGIMKLTKSKDQLIANPAMGWASDFSPGVLKFIGCAEIAGAIGLILPGALGVATWLIPTAAIGLAIVMAGAVITHGRRKELTNIVINLALLALALLVAIEHTGPQSF